MRLCGFEAGGSSPLFLIAGPCVIESEDLVMRVAERLSGLCRRLEIGFVFKSSYDKANRSSHSSFRGPGLDEGLAILAKVRRELACPVLTDVHSAGQVAEAGEVVDVLQTPAFLCRQTDLIQAAAASGLPVNIKKGQFLAPGEMNSVVDKARAAGGEGRLLVCERGTMFGYHNLVVDMRALEILRGTGCPVVFDATHSVQQPGGQGDRSGGQSQFVPLLARAAVAVGVAGLFMETHPEPEQALSDGPNAVPLERMESLLAGLLEIDRLVKARLDMA
jgi:2-dehydro-3-deoxyphosphooctonate aldolase (KDO 8-P synthase)